MSTLSVSTAASTRSLTTLPMVKSVLQIEDGKSDDWLKLQIRVASMMVARYLNIVPADDATVTLGRETLIETFRPTRDGHAFVNSGIDRAAVLDGAPPTNYLLLSRRPIVSIETVVVDGTTLDATEYESDSAGRLKRLFNDAMAGWTANKVVVTYIAGWILPGEIGRNLPDDIEAATISLIKAATFARGRDPNIKSENIPGVLETNYFFRSPEPGAPLPDEIAQQLNSYRQINI